MKNKQYSLHEFFTAFKKKKWQYPTEPVIEKGRLRAFKWSEIFRKLAKLQFVTLTLKAYRERTIAIMKTKSKFKTIKFKKVNIFIWLNSILFLFFIIIFLYGCGSDNVTGPNNPPVGNDSLIFSLDSLRCDYHDSTSFGIFVKFFFTTIDSTPKIRITFDAATNDQFASNEIAITKDTTQHYLQNPDTSYSSSSMNGSYNLVWNISHRTFFILMNCDSPYYSVIRKIKIYKTN